MSITDDNTPWTDGTLLLKQRIAELEAANAMLERRITESDKLIHDWLASEPNRNLRLMKERAEKAEQRIAELEAERDKLNDILKDPAAVWANMLYGKIARPQALEHYEECKQRVEELEAANDKLRAVAAKAKIVYDSNKQCLCGNQGECKDCDKLIALGDALAALDDNPRKE